MPDYVTTLYDLGSQFLYVAGDCHYWVMQTSDFPDEYRHWRPYREGVLTPAQEAALHTAVGYDDFSRAPDCGETTAVDADAARMWDGTRVYVCNGDLQVTAGWPMRAELYSSATPVAGPMRIQVTQTPTLDNSLRHPWPLTTSPELYVGDYGASFRIDDVASAAALRQLRERALADAARAPGFFPGYIAIDSSAYALPPGDGYALALRDELPFTDAAGFWNPPR